MFSEIIKLIIDSFKENRINIISKLFLGILTFTIIYIIIKYIVQKVKNKIIEKNLINNKYSEKTTKLVGTILFIIMMIFNILATLEIIGFDTAIIIGAIFLSVGFSMESIISDMIAGLFILTNKKVKLGDFVEFGGKLNIRGTIEEINIRYTIVRSFDKRRTIIPNSIIAKTPIKTIKSEPILRGEIKFRIPRGIPLLTIKKIFSETINENNKLIHKEYSNIMIESFGSKGIHLKGFFFCNPSNIHPIVISREIKKSFIEKLKKQNIKVPFYHIVLSTE